MSNPNQNPNQNPSTPKRPDSPGEVGTPPGPEIPAASPNPEVPPKPQRDLPQPDRERAENEGMIADRTEQEPKKDDTVIH